MLFNKFSKVELYGACPCYYSAATSGLMITDGYQTLSRHLHLISSQLVTWPEYMPVYASDEVNFDNSYHQARLFVT